MRFKYCVAMLLFVAVIGVVVLAMPAVAVKTGDSTTLAGPGGYSVTLMKNPSSIRPLAVYGTIHQSEYQYQSKLINYYTTSQPFDLYWGNPSNSLRLRIITPDGYVLGPFYDASDGFINGDIYLVVSRSGGIAQGTWYTEVYGDRVSGAQSYSI
jgi:hypothetical protein